MTETEYLKSVLKSQDLADDSSEMKDLVKRRGDVEGILRAAFPDCTPTIRYGGSKAKGTLIKESYDLDLVCYFAHDDTSAGETLEEIYNNVHDALTPTYHVTRKRSALRLRGKEDLVDFHIDVVPGRFTDDTKTDCFLHQEAGDKERLKTNLDVHIDHVRNSGVLDALRLLKLWKARKALAVKQFAFELAIIEILDGTDKPLPDQLTYVLTEFRDSEKVTIEDPANPSGNDLSDLLDDAVWSELGAAAEATLKTKESSGWEGVFGAVPNEESKASRVRVAAASVSVPTRPWASQE